jgi:hypothetical protein
MALGPTQPLTEMSSMNIPIGCKGRPGRTADSLKAMYDMSRLSRKFGVLNVSQPYRPPRPVTGIALLYGDGVFFQ